MSAPVNPGRRIANGLLLGAAALASPSAFAATDGDSGLEAADGLTAFLEQVSAMFTGPLGIAIGIIAFAAVGVYIMYARQTGQAVGSIAKVFIGLLILFGGTQMVTQIGDQVGGALF